MSDFQKAGFCHRCNENPCFEVLALWADNERYPGEPKRLGPTYEDAVRVTFMLIDGTRADLQICGACKESLSADDYPLMWQRILRSWKREIDLDTNPSEQKRAWFVTQFSNGLLAEMGRRSLKEAHGG